MHRRQRLILILALAVGGWGGVAQAADSYGSIAFSPTTRANGFWYGAPDKEAAEARAMAECRKRAGDCRVGINFWNSCGAVAVGKRAGWGSAWATTGEAAQALALQYCRERDQDCQVIRWQCSLND